MTPCQWVHTVCTIFGEYDADIMEMWILLKMFVSEYTTNLWAT